MATDDLSTNIVTNAQGPKSASGDSGSMEQHDLVSQILADKYIQSKAASRKTGLGIKFVKIAAGGTV